MDLSTPVVADDLSRMHDHRGHAGDDTRSSHSAVSWAAIVAGAAAAASLSLILLILGVGLGLSSVSPWARQGVNATTFGLSTILWLTLTQLLASGVGGYLAGRLRTRWAGVHTDEVYFRDTAHGFLAWAVASLATAALLTSVIGSILGGGVQAGASIAEGVANTAGAALGGAAVSSRTEQGTEGGPMAYFIDALFRPVAGGATLASPADAKAGTGATERANNKASAEIGRIFMNVSRSGPLPPDDIRYVGQIVAQRTGLSQRDAE
jgi:hypothetical protein